MTKEYHGYIKCKLLHKASGSLVFPDQIYIDHTPLLWYQPQHLAVNTVCRTDTSITCDLWVDVLSGDSLHVTFEDSQFIRRFDDGSELYRCSIKADRDVTHSATGIARLTGDNISLLRLFHHTTPCAKGSIESSGSVRGSAWNFQGNKELRDVAYAYFTSVKSVKSEEDLRRMAMASDGLIFFGTDNIEFPARPTAAWASRHLSDVLPLKVYRESTRNRTATVTVWIDASLLSPHHILFHTGDSLAAYHEICGAYIQRIGVEPGARVTITNKEVVLPQSHLKRFDYAIIGDATALAGLAAPYDEEDTTYHFKIERVSAPSNILRFWLEHGNQDLFSHKGVSFQSFKGTS